MSNVVAIDGPPPPDLSEIHAVEVSFDAGRGPRTLEMVFPKAKTEGEAERLALLIATTVKGALIRAMKQS